MMMFSNWVRWPERSQLGKILKYPGIYLVSFSPNENLHDKPFEWNANIIYVGMTNSALGLRGRLKQFDDTLKETRCNHGGADRVHYKYRDYENFVSSAYVAINYIECDVTSNDPQNLRKMGQVAENEYLAMAEFVERFRRLPEFNNKKETMKFSKMKNKV